MMVMLENPRTGDHKALKVGWSWSLFMFANAFGFPLFRRGLVVWGAVMVVLGGLNLALPLMAVGAANGPIWEAQGMLTALIFGFSVFFALKGNAMTARRYFLLGYRFARPDSPEARHAMTRWGVDHNDHRDQAREFVHSRG